MSLQNSLFATTKSDGVRGDAKAIWRQLSCYVIFVGFGLIGGATGVALTIALAIVAQRLIFPQSVFSPNPVLFAVIAVLVGLVVSWLLSWAIDRIFAHSYNLDKQKLQVMFVFSALISLLESFLFIKAW